MKLNDDEAKQDAIMDEMESVFKQRIEFARYGCEIMQCDKQFKANLNLARAGAMEAYKGNVGQERILRLLELLAEASAAESFMLQAWDRCVFGEKDE